MQSASTNGFNTHYTVQWSNPVVEMSAGELKFLRGPSLLQSVQPG